MTDEPMTSDMEVKPKIEPTAYAERLQLKRWTCQDCGSRHSRKHDAERHWHKKHGEQSEK